jgi:hypothetical protein
MAGKTASQNRTIGSFQPEVAQETPLLVKVAENNIGLLHAVMAGPVPAMTEEIS